MAGFMDKVRKARDRRDAAMERARDNNERKADAPAAPKKRKPVKHQMEKGQPNKPHSITGGQDERERKMRENARRIRELEGR